MDRLKMAAQTKKRDAQSKLQEAIELQGVYRGKEAVLAEAQRVSDKQRAIELENLPFSEQLKMKADQERR